MRPDRPLASIPVWTTPLQYARPPISGTVYRFRDCHVLCLPCESLSLDRSQPHKNIQLLLSESRISTNPVTWIHQALGMSALAKSDGQTFSPEGSQNT